MKMLNYLFYLFWKGSVFTVSEDVWMTNIPSSQSQPSVCFPAGAAGGEEAAGGRGEDEEAAVSRAARDSAGGVTAAEVKAGNEFPV